MTSKHGTDSRRQSGEHNDALKRFREKMKLTLERYPAYDTDFSLERWLQAYDDIDEAAENMKWALNAIDVLGAYREYDSVEAVNEYMISMNPVARYFPGGIMGSDKNGNVISLQPMGRARPRSVMPLGRVSDVYRACIVEAEACLSFVRKEEAKRNCKLGVILISDLDELSRETIYMPAVNAYFNVLNVLQRLFPNSIQKVYVINAPSLVNALFSMAKKILSKRMVEKIHFLGGDWKEKLKENFGEENLFEKWGGTKAASTPTGSIRMAGEVPHELREEILRSIERLPEDQLESAVIPAGSSLTLPTDVIKGGSTLCWYFTITSGDVDFWITKEDFEVWPRLTVSTEFVPEYGQLECRKKGTYVLHFESNAKFFSKSVSYKVEVK